MRQQYHIRSVDGEKLIWDVYRLVELSKDFPVFELSIANIRELDEHYWFTDGETPTPRQIASHAKLISEADLNYPVIMCSRGKVMDGMHRICRAWLESRPSVPAVQFEVDPSPDYFDVRPEDLPY